MEEWLSYFLLPQDTSVEKMKADAYMVSKYLARQFGDAAATCYKIHSEMIDVQKFSCEFHNKLCLELVL